jgi:hypothetical protein
MLQSMGLVLSTKRTIISHLHKIKPHQAINQMLPHTEQQSNIIMTMIKFWPKIPRLETAPIQLQPLKLNHRNTQQQPLRFKKEWRPKITLNNQRSTWSRLNHKTQIIIKTRLRLNKVRIIQLYHHLMNNRTRIMITTCLRACQHSHRLIQFIQLILYLHHLTSNMMFHCNQSRHLSLSKNIHMRIS